MSDLISRQAAIDELDKGAWGAEWDKALAQAMIESLPSAQPQRNPNEWCHDCKEYDQERHCCPRFNNVIRKTVQECREGYNIVYCKECEYYHDFGNFGKCDYFSIDEKHVEVLTDPYDWCSGAIKRDGEQDGSD